MTVWTAVDEAFALELFGDVVEVDADGCQLIEDVARIVVPPRAPYTFQAGHTSSISAHRNFGAGGMRDAGAVPLVAGF